MVSPFRQDVNDIAAVPYGLAQDSANTIQNWAQTALQPDSNANGSHNLPRDIADTAKTLYNAAGTAGTGVLNAGKFIGDTASGVAKGVGTASQLAGQEVNRYFTDPDAAKPSTPMQKDMAQLPRSSYNPAAEAASSNAAAGAANQMVTDIRARDEGKKAGAQYGAMGENLGYEKYLASLNPTYTDARTPEQIDASAARNQMALATLTPEQQMARGMPVSSSVAAAAPMPTTFSGGQNRQAQYDMNPRGMYGQMMGQKQSINPGLGRRMADTPRSTGFRPNGIPSRFAGSTDPMAASKTRII